MTRPSPRSLAGRPAPATRVRPVDWSATGKRPTGEGNRPTEEEQGPTEEEQRPTGEASPSARLPGPRPGPPQGQSTVPRPGPRRRAETIELPRPAPAPPENAVHTLQPDDPHPAPRPLRIRAELIRTVGIEELSTEQLVETVADPEDAWTADAGASDHFLRGDLVVQVRRTDNTVIGAFSRGYALAVRPEQYESALEAAIEAAGPSARGGRGTRHPTTRRELIARMQAAGFVITPGASHGRVSHPEHPGLFVPLASTPSDRRFTRHAVAQIRRVFGIDLRS